MSAEEALSIAVGLVNLAVVVAIAIRLRHVGLRPPLPLVALGVVFAIRAIARLVPTVGDEPESLLLVLDLGLLFALVLFLMSTRRLVTSFVYEREALQRAQIDYDDSLARYESQVAAQHEGAVARLGAALDRLDADRSDDAALADARAALGVLRADG